MLAFFRKIVSNNDEVLKLQSNVENALAPVLRVALLDGVTISAALASGDNEIAHGLGRVPQGYIIIDVDAAATIYRVSLSDKFLTLNSTATANIKLWIY